MELILYLLPVDFLFAWQSLIGSFLGPFLAIILSTTGLWIEIKLRKRHDREEAIRRAEIAFSQTLTHMNVAVLQLEEFIHRAKQILKQVEEISDPTKYSIPETNFPATIGIEFDADLIAMKFKSYYIHNKILIADYLVKTSNDNARQFRHDFERLLNRNEKIVMWGKINAKEQRAAFIDNLDGYIKMIETFVDALQNNYIQSIAEAKIYNLKLMDGQLHTLWMYEGKFRYFKNKKEMKKFNGSMDAVDRIDKLLEVDTIKLMSDMKERRKSHDKP